MDCILPDSSIMGFSRQEYWSTMPWKEIEENKRMEKTRDLFRKIRETKGTLHAKMGTIKDRNDMDLTEAEDIKKRWREYTEELNDHTKKILMT